MNTIIKDPNLEPFFISKDKYCYSVVEVITPERTRNNNSNPPQTYEKSLGYYTTLGKALKKIAKEQLNDPKVTYDSVKEYLDRLDELNNKMESLIEKIGI